MRREFRARRRSPDTPPCGVVCLGSRKEGAVRLGDRETVDVPGDLEDELDRLYGVGLADFVAERTRLAGGLRKEGRQAEATRVQELRKPSLSVWLRRPRAAQGEDEPPTRLELAGMDQLDSGVRIRPTRQPERT